MMQQLKTFQKYAEKTGKIDIAKKYENSYKLVQGIHKERKGLIRDNGERDAFFDNLERSLSSFK